MMPLAASKSLPARQTGSYLLEALIAILIFAFGVLGLVGMIGTSIRVTNDARYRPRNKFRLRDCDQGNLG